MRIPIRGFATLAVLAAATTASFATEASYSCDGGSRVTAIFSPVGTTPGNVELLFAGKDGDLVLPQVQSADGGRYAEGDNEFWIKGNSASLTLSGKSEICEVSSSGAN